MVALCLQYMWQQWNYTNVDMYFNRKNPLRNRDLFVEYVQIYFLFY